MKIIEPVWRNFKPNNTSRISLRIFVIHHSKAQVVIDKIFLLFALHKKMDAYNITDITGNQSNKQ